MSGINAIFYIAILVMSVVIHEVSHGYVAEACGDSTARMSGRLTLNPLRHLDFVGSFLIPAVLVLTHTPFLIGWAKPVPYNPYNLRNKKWGTIAVASAGVLANLFIALIFGLLLRFTASSNMPEGFDFIISSIVLVNLGLMIFNLVPIPPLDGSKILFSFLPNSAHQIVDFLERYSLICIFIFIICFSNYLAPILVFLYKLITGFSF
jgi:Zn-dependent protease